jgi:hypothetical protein
MQNILKTLIVLFLTVSTCDFMTTPLLADTGQVVVYRSRYFRKWWRIKKPQPVVFPVETQSVTTPEQIKPQSVKLSPTNSEVAFTSQHTTTVDRAPQPVDESILDDLFPEGRGNAKIFYEDIQQAVIAWNGKEELLVLTTRQTPKVKHDAAVISFLPLPGKPFNITGGNPNLYDKLSKKLYQLADTQWDNWYQKWKGGRGSKAFEVLMKKQIGSHNIVAIKVIDKDIDAFYESLHQYIVSNFGEDAAAFIPEDGKKVFEHYIKERDFQYFAVDFQEIKADGKPKEKEAIAYCFESPSLFYSLYISRLGGGNEKTQVQLATVMPDTKIKLAGYKEESLYADSTPPLTVRSSDLRDVDKDLADFMSKTNKNDSFLGMVWIITGELNSFNQDFIIEPKK